jgi:F0F1-type ATP synthase assembly protein I
LVVIPSRNDLGAQAWAASFTFAVAVALFTLAGVWLDAQFGTRFVFLIVGFLLGTVGGFLHLISRLAPQYLARKDAPRRSESVPPTAQRSADQRPRGDT